MQAIVARRPECSLPVKGDLAVQNRQKSNDDAASAAGSAGTLDDRYMEARKAQELVLCVL